MAEKKAEQANVGAATIDRALEAMHANGYVPGDGATGRGRDGAGELINESCSVCSGRGAVTSDGAPIEDDVAGYFTGPFCDLDGRY